MVPALRNRTFRRIAALYSVNLVIEWFVSVALMVIVYGTTHSASLAALVLIIGEGLPGVVVPLLGPALDRRNAGRAIAIAFALQAGVLVVLAELAYGPLLFVLAFFTGILGAVVRSLLRASVARSLGPDDLRGGNALLNVITGVSAPLGPGLAAVTVAGAGEDAAILVAAACMALLSVACVGLRLSGESPAPEDDASDAKTAERRTTSTPPLPWLLASVAVIIALFCMDQPALLAYSQHDLHAGVGGYGAIFTSWGVGSAIGSLLFARLLHWPMLRVYAVATALSGLALVGLGLAPSITVACAFAVLCGVGNGMDWVAIVTVIQEATPRGHEARTATRLESISMAAPVVGILIGGIAADLTSPRFAIGISGALALVVLASCAAALRVRGLQLQGTRPAVLPAPIPGGTS